MLDEHFSDTGRIMRELNSVYKGRKVLPMLLLLLLETCSCIEINSTVKWNKENSSVSTYHFTTEKIFLNYSEFASNITLNESLFINQTNVTKGSHNTSAQKPWVPDDPEKELPFTIIVAGPTAAFFIIIFLCVAFYFHNLQLNKKAHKLSFTMYVTADQTPGLNREGSETGSFRSAMVNTNGLTSASCQNLRLQRDPSAQSLRMSRENSTLSMRLSRDGEMFTPPRRSTVSLGLPSRGSTLSAFSDQEVVNQSSKRKHSIFIL